MTETDLFTEAQERTLRAAVDRIIPADDFPGGWEAGVGHYLSRLLATEPGMTADYRAGLDALAAEAEAQHHQPFEALPPEAQDRLLAQIEAGRVRTSWPLAPARFFRRLVDQAMEGFYADPGNGGNRDGVAWRMIGFEVRY